MLQATVTPGVVDTQCGAKVTRRDIWEAVLPRCREVGFAWDAEAIAVALSMRIPVQEVAIAWRHDDRTKVRLGRDGAAMVWATARVWRNARRVARDDSVRTAGEVFDAANAGLLMGVDKRHWWFRSKAALVATALRRTAPEGGSAGWLVDAGAGAGGVTTRLGWALGRVVLVEGNEALVVHARRQRGLFGVRAGVDRLPLADRSAQIVCLLDVIEHLREPRAALQEAARVLAPGGRLVVNVPAHQWLWSSADELLGHVRRYTRSTLRQQLGDVGFRPVVLTHVFSWLVPMVWLKRLFAKGGGSELGLEQTGTLVDRAAMVLTAVERTAVGRLAVPFGASILCVAVKEGSGRVSTTPAGGG